MRIVLALCGILLCCGGLVRLAAVSLGGYIISSAEEALVLVSVVPGMILIVAGIQMQKSGRSRWVDMTLLVVSIIWLLILTWIPVTASRPLLL